MSEQFVRASQIDALLAVERAARSYFDHYLQDEADELDVCMDELQHERAVALKAALDAVGGSTK